ncbi:MAG TPA: acetyl-CoA carboxylase biotin carboxylase subunit [Terriglobales bacterium]|nr:acetyl-CoA carboxylase biotin carboxylase subunit [Terriglobales bacterium]
MFKKILIANRGEIAVRVIRACREMSIASVAVYSDVDRNALHVRKADEAYGIGPANARESYLNIEKILAVAKRSGADAIHPGYGFLSENPLFAQACTDAGIKFIGPTAAAMNMMGSKTSARRAMEAAGVPFVPGSSHGLTLKEAQEVSAKVGYPVMLKAAAGGGGKGMRLVNAAIELEAAYDAASSEALRAFSNGEVYVEKFIAQPRHIEVQVFGDEYGNVVHLGERECSVQRRHQKVVEESPSAIVDEAMRQRMGETAVRVAKAAGYTNAGTVEFLVDAQKNFYFLEMNTRLQVEHPVTEQVTGIDLVHLQIRTAAGDKLPFTQKEIQLRGHAIECRIYAEDPDNSFFPSPGEITKLVLPSGPGIREDSGVFEGWNVPLDYDPMLSKLIAFAPTRQQAIARMRRALDEYFVGGIKTNLKLFRQILDHQDFISGKIDTGFLDRMLGGAQSAVLAGKAVPSEVVAIAAALFSMNGASARTGANSNGAPQKQSSLEFAESEAEWKRLARREALRGSR